MKLGLNVINRAVDRVRQLPPKEKEKWAEMAIIWGVPTVAVPSLRYVNDADKPENIRKELFLRDFAGYSIGSAIFLGGLWFLSEKVKKVKNLTAIAIASTASAVWCGFIDPKISKLLTRVEARTTKLPARKLDIEAS